MKKIILSLVAMVIATVSFAQSSLLATLSHNGTISTYYGTTALKDALANADHGDAITLSAGQFQAGDITKAITLRGAGMSVRNDSVNTHEATIIQGSFSILLTDSVPERLIIEGLYCASTTYYRGIINNALFMKSRFSRISPATGTTEKRIVNSSFIHCRIASGLELTNNSNAYLVNSVVMYPNNYQTSYSSFEFNNCVVGFNNNTYTSRVINSGYKNCIILDSFGYAIPSSSVAYNSVGIVTDGTNMFGSILGSNKTNTLINNASLSSLFKTLKSYNYSDSEMYEWTDESKAKYLGTDGKEVGIYGGNLPYEEDPTTPQITKCNVAAKSTADGKLSVDIEVKAAEY